MTLTKRDLEYLMSMLEKISMIQCMQRDEDGLSTVTDVTYNLILNNKLRTMYEEKRHDGI